MRLGQHAKSVVPAIVYITQTRFARTTLFPSPESSEASMKLARNVIF
jgi:hypothetical protein